jgi:hypothetical protein
MSAPTRLDWQHSYQHTQRSTAATLRDERARGVRFHNFGSGVVLPPCDPARMSDRKIDEAAREHARITVERAINQEIATRRRRGQPLHGMVESV